MPVREHTQEEGMRSPKCADCGHVEASHLKDIGCKVRWTGLDSPFGCMCGEYRKRWSKSRNHIPEEA